MTEKIEMNKNFLYLGSRTIELARKPFSIFPEEVPKCPLPEDNLGMGPSGGATPVAFRLAFFYLFVGFAVFLFGN